MSLTEHHPNHRSVPSPVISAFLTEQTEGLDEFDFLRVVPIKRPEHSLEISRPADGEYVVRVPARPTDFPLLPEERHQLDDWGYTSDDPSESLGERHFERAPEAAAAAATVLREVFGHPDSTLLDVWHGSRRAQHEAAENLRLLHEQVVPVLTKLCGGAPARDPDGDYVVPHAQTHVIVAPRSNPGGIPLVRVATVTNANVALSHEAGTFLANLNFGLAVGRFALDIEHRQIWVDETLIGVECVASSLRPAIEIVAHTAAEWSPKFRRMFGGLQVGVAGPDATVSATGPKPGEGGYL